MPRRLPGSAADLAVDEIVDAYAAGCSCAQIGESVGATAARVRRALIAADVVLRGPQDRSYPAPDAQMLSGWFIEDGLSIAEIGRRCGGAPPGAVKRWISEATLSRVPPGRADRRVFSRAELDQARRRYLHDGVRLGDLAVEMRVSARVLSRNLTDDGLEIIRGAPPPTPGKARPSDGDLERWYVHEQRTCAQIGADTGWSANWVLWRLERLGIERRPAHAQRLVDDEEIVRLYVDERRSSTWIAENIGIGAGVVFDVLQRNGHQPRHRAEARTRIPVEQVAVLVEEGLTDGRIAERLGCSPSAVHACRHRHGLSRNQRRLTVDDANHIRRMYCDDLLSDHAIADHLGVAVFAVRMMRRRAGITRRVSVRAQQPPDPDELVELYVTQHLTMTSVAVHYGVNPTTVRRWLRDAGIAARRFPTRSGGDYGPTDLDPTDLRDLYVTQRLSAATIATKLNVSKRTVLAALHTCGYAVRENGFDDTEAVLRHELNNDVEVIDILARHRWQAPKKPSDQLVTGLYTEVGLSGLAIRILTGMDETTIRVTLARNGVPLRDNERSPWRARHPK